MRAFTFIIGTGAFALGLIGQTSSLSNPVAGYRTWHQVTKEPVFLHPKVNLMCASVPVLDDPQQPHVPKRFRVYMNPVAAGALTSRKPYPSGSLIVKEKLSEDGTTAELLTVMKKGSKGSGKVTDDWHFYTAHPDGRRISASIMHCVRCHEVPKGWVFGGYGSLPFAKSRAGKSIYDPLPNGGLGDN